MTPVNLADLRNRYQLRGMARVTRQLDALAEAILEAPAIQWCKTHERQEVYRPCPDYHMNCVVVTYRLVEVTEEASDGS